MMERLLGNGCSAGLCQMGGFANMSGHLTTKCYGQVFLDVLVACLWIKGLLVVSKWIFPNQYLFI